MEVHISSRNLDIPDTIKDLIEEKVRKLTKFDRRIHRVEIIVEKQKHIYRSELLVTADHYTAEVHAEDVEDLSLCLESAVNKAEKRLRRHKEKRIDRKHRRHSPSSFFMTDEEE